MADLNGPRGLPVVPGGGRPSKRARKTADKVKNFGPTQHDCKKAGCKQTSGTNHCVPRDRRWDQLVKELESKLSIKPEDKRPVCKHTRECLYHVPRDRRWDQLMKELEGKKQT